VRNSAAPHLLPKITTGIDGFDELSLGGLPRNRTTLLKGGPGSGKTVFALQSLVNAVRRHREPGIFVAFEESTRQIMTNAATFDWGLPALARSKLFFLDAHLSPEVVHSGEFDLSAMSPDDPGLYLTPQGFRPFEPREPRRRPRRDRRGQD